MFSCLESSFSLSTSKATIHPTPRCLHSTRGDSCNSLDPKHLGVAVSSAKLEPEQESEEEEHDLREERAADWLSEVKAPQSGVLKVIRYCHEGKNKRCLKSRRTLLNSGLQQG